MAEDTIAARSRKVVALFSSLLEIAPREQATEPDVTDYDNQAGRFNMWCANIGVFAEHRVSLDYRLHESPQGKSLMKDLIDGLQRYIRRAIHESGIDKTEFSWNSAENLANDATSDTYYSTPSSYLSSQATFESVSEAEDLTLAQERLRGIEEIIDKLYRLSTIIRKPSSTRQYAKSAAFPITDEDGNNCENEFLHFAVKCVHRQFPNVNETLMERLASTIRLRRKMFLYRQRHQMKLRYQSPDAETGQPFVKPRLEISTVVNLTSAGEQSGKSAHRGPKPSIPPSVTTASAFSSSKLALALGVQSVITQTVAAASTYNPSLHIPRPPVPSPGSKEVECPYCCMMIPIKDTKTNEWRRHFLQDLEPFVCTFDPCPEADRLYHDRRAWLAHMEEVHCLRQFVCSAPGHGVKFFDSEVSYEKHMWLTHPGTFAENHLPLLKRRAQRSAPVYTSCPLCGFDPEAQTTEHESSQRPYVKSESSSEELSKHIAAHFVSLAMISLPWDSDEGEEEVAKSQAAISDEETMQSDRDLPPATFDGDEDIVAGQGTLQTEILQPNPFADTLAGTSIPTNAVIRYEWSFIEQLPYYGHDRDPTLQPFLRKLYIESSPYVLSNKGPVLPCHLIPFGKNNSFFGRERALNEIAQALCPSALTSMLSSTETLFSNPRTFAIYGPGGMGKTQVAIEFVYRHRDEFDAIFWVNAGNQTQLDQDFNQIALCLGLVADESSEARDFKYTRELVKRWLLDPLRHTENNKSGWASWLLIYDGVDDLGTINEFWPYDAPGSVLITSRSPSSWTQSWQLLPFSEEESISFLLQLTGRECDDDAMRSQVAGVNEKLGGLPLALTQMAGVMTHRDMTFSEFIDAYNKREKRQALLSASPATNRQPYRYGHSLASVWALEHLSPMATALLNTFSMFHPDGIPDRLYTESIGKIGLAGFPDTLQAYRIARIKLLDASLVTGNRARRQFFVHRIVQDVARMRLGEQQFRDTFLACVQLVSLLWPFERFPSWRHSIERWSICEELFPHVLSLKELADQTMPSTEDFAGDYRFVRLLTDAGWYRHERGRSDESTLFNDLAQSICEIWMERFAERLNLTAEEDLQVESLHATIAEILHNRGCIATEINAPEDALKYFGAFNSMMLQEFNAKPAMTRVDMRLAISWNELGNAHMLQKRWSEGERCFSRSIETLENLDNFKDTDLSLPLVNIGLSYWLQQRHDEALKILLKGLHDQEMAYGENERKSFTKGRYLHALGNVKASMGCPDESLEYHRMALQHYRATLGHSHHRTADVYVKVTEHSIRMRQEETAMALIDHALRAYSDVEIYAPEKARATFIRGQVLRIMGRPADANTALETAAKLYGELVGRTDYLAEVLTKADFDELIAFWSR